MVKKYEANQVLNMTIEQAWEYFSSPKNLEEITPEYLRFKILTDLPPKMYQGMIIKYKVTPLLGIPINWVTEITHVREMEYFVDEQRFGPYKFWHHQHFFRKIGDKTEMKDIIHYAVPMGLLGRIMTQKIVDTKVKEIFEHRKKVLDLKFNL
jgi:ligand-binding SRPBCC domain-containing protein